VDEFIKGFESVMEWGVTGMISRYAAKSIA
jgi:hypothetical protein